MEFTCSEVTGSISQCHGPCRRSGLRGVGEDAECNVNQAWHLCLNIEDKKSLLMTMEVRASNLVACALPRKFNQSTHDLLDIVTYLAPFVLPALYIYAWFNGCHKVVLWL